MKADRTVAHPSDLSWLPHGATVLWITHQYAYKQTVMITEHELVVYKLGDKIHRAYLPM